jgi:hypothetical protein
MYFALATINDTWEELGKIFMQKDPFHDPLCQTRTITSVDIEWL